MKLKFDKENETAIEKIQHKYSSRNKDILFNSPGEKLSTIKSEMAS